MADATFTGAFLGARRRHPLPARVHAAWRNHFRRRANRLALAHLGPRLLADAGFSDEEIATLRGGWDNLLPNGYLVHRR